MKDKLFNILENGRERIIGREKYIISAVFIAITKLNNQEYLILEKRALHIRQGGEISFPGGKYDTQDITTEETAIRECIEELGVSRDKIESLGKFGNLVSPNGMILEVYLGYVHINSLDELNFNRDEVEKIILVPLEFFITNNPRVEKIGIENIPQFSTSELRLPKRYGDSWAGRPREVYFYNYQDEIIWGLTAEIIYEFIQMYR